MKKKGKRVRLCDPAQENNGTVNVVVDEKKPPGTRGRPRKKGPPSPPAGPPPAPPAPPHGSSHGDPAPQQSASLKLSMTTPSHIDGKSKTSGGQVNLFVLNWDEITLNV